MVVDLVDFRSGGSLRWSAARLGAATARGNVIIHEGVVKDEG